ncbi:GspE/PulE family protein [Vibrio anguillarum]|uniref:GspE/PulE family protein n=6 Tax=Vibrio anguillarum TaxID=55601 RepID=UPI000BB5102C|nr:ATPase, T2SS/T4P/T4SS family [Vibrio anguillarum]ATC60176.1 hypothetical protein CMV05_22565 [Vibrio anguillarum]MBF4250664.1 hypothetical protein [Vibrio anguillarum]MBF4342088.1 hypothetical protein [Vibrio anguillarum]
MNTILDDTLTAPVSATTVNSNMLNSDFLKEEASYGVEDIDMHVYEEAVSQKLSLIPLTSGKILVSKDTLEQHFKLVQSLKAKIREDGTRLASVKVTNQEEVDRLVSLAEERRGKADKANDKKDIYEAKVEFLKLMQKGVDHNASDVQLVLGKSLVVNYIVDKRIRPDLRQVRERDIGRRMILQAVNTNRGGGDLNYDTPQSIKLKVTVKDEQKLDRNIQLRGEKVPIEIEGVENALLLVVRLVKTETPLSLEELNVDLPLQHAFKRSLLKPKGMILVTGPTSSGKTTLLGGAMHHFPKDLPARTIEDPVELKLHDISENIVQMSQPKEYWDEYLLSILRLAPKLIMLGEIRSLNQADTLIAATMTGHITVSTMHTNSAIGIIDRFLDMGVKLEDITAPGLLELLVATRLVPKTCHHCALEFSEIDEDKQTQIRNVFDEEHIGKLLFANTESIACKRHAKPEVCTCSGGIKGVVGISEFITPTNAMIDFVRKNKTVGLENWLRERGWKSMHDIAKYKCEQGLVDPFMAAYEVEGLLEKAEYDPSFHQVFSFYDEVHL